MNSIADGSVIVQTSCQSVPSTPSWFGEVALLAQHLGKQGILSAVCEHVRFARRRFGHYDVIDGCRLCSSGMPSVTNGRWKPSTSACIPLLPPSWRSSDGSVCLPARRRDRFLASLTQATVEALRTLFLEDLLARPLGTERQTGGLGDRAGNERVVFDIDGTREAARQRALPKAPALPIPQRRLDELCAPGYTGRKRGEIVRTRTTVSQAHT